jgi:hypothetical protein
MNYEVTYNEWTANIGVVKTVIVKDVNHFSQYGPTSAAFYREGEKSSQLVAAFTQLISVVAIEDAA